MSADSAASLKAQLLARAIPGLPAPRLRAYLREVSIAEKFEAMIQLDTRNSRMKDFHDVWALSGAFVLVPPPADFDAIGERIVRFLGPVRESLVADVPIARHWPAGGPWL